MKISYDKICSFLGSPLKNVGDYSYWQCPICMDRGKDNLIYTHSKGLLTCFANNDHSHEIYKMINQSEYKNKVQEFNMKMNISKQDNQKLEIDIKYICQCSHDLEYDMQAKAFLKKQRGLYGETLNLGIGIDKANKRWVFPAMSIEFPYKLIGAEYRTCKMIIPKNKRSKDYKGGLYKAKGTPADLCLINQASNKNKSLIIIEGFIDGYTLWQYLKEHGQQDDYEIATPTNGVGIIPSLLDKIPITKYKDIVFWLDNDEAGRSVICKIKKIAKFNFSVNKLPCECCKDFNEWYLKHERAHV